MANRYDVKCNPSVPYIVPETNSASQVEFTEHKYSYTGIKLMQRPSTPLRECPVTYKTPVAFWEP